MNRRILSALLLVSAGCATTQGAGETTATDAQRRERLINRSEFNVAVCQPVPVEPAVSTEETVVGALVSSRPLITECLVDPKTRGPEKETTVTVDTTVTEAGAQHQVTGTNLTPEGQACAEAAVAKTVKLPPVAKGAQPVKGQVQVVHVADVSPGVIWGNNEASDIVGAIRLGQPTWCECYAGFTDHAPPTVKAWVKALKGTTSLSEVVWTATTETKPPEALLRAKQPEAKPGEAPGAAAPAGSAEEKQLTDCLSTKLQQLQLVAAPTEDKVVPYTFEHIHSKADKAAANASPELAFRHLDALRVTRQADAVVANGEWMAAANTFADLATRYNKRDKKVTYNQVKAQCGVRQKAAEAWLAQLNGQLEVEKRQVALAQEQAAKNESWAEAVTKVGEQVAQTEAARDQVQKQRDEDAALCKKL